MKSGIELIAEERQRHIDQLSEALVARTDALQEIAQGECLCAVLRTPACPSCKAAYALTDGAA